MSRCGWKRTQLDAHRARTAERPAIAVSRSQFSRELQARLGRGCRSPKSCRRKLISRRRGNSVPLEPSDSPPTRLRMAAPADEYLALELATTRGVHRGPGKR